MADNEDDLVEYDEEEVSGSYSEPSPLGHWMND